MHPLDDLAHCIGDPGSVVKREPGESVPRWAVRAVLASGLVVPTAQVAAQASEVGFQRDVERDAQNDRLLSATAAHEAASRRAVLAEHRADRLAAQVAAVRALCQDTDGNWLHPEVELPVGEFQAALDADQAPPTGGADASAG